MPRYRVYSDRPANWFERLAARLVVRVLVGKSKKVARKKGTYKR